MQNPDSVSLQGVSSGTAVHARPAEGLEPAADAASEAAGPVPQAAGPAPEAAGPAMGAAGVLPKSAGAVGVKINAKQSLEEMAAWLDAQLAAAPGKVLTYSVLTALMVETA